VERLVMLARLKPEARDRALELVEEHRAGHAAETDFERHAIFLAPEEIVFYFEGQDAEKTARRILNDPVRSTMLAPWLPLFDGPLHAAPEVDYWERGDVAS
jgi:hypothetical protein